MRRTLTAATAVAGTCLMACAGAGAGQSGAGTGQSGARTDGKPVAVVLDEYHVKVNYPTVASGRVTYNVINSGHEKHEMVLLRTDIDPASLPADNTGKVLEEGAGIEHVDEIDGVDPGRTGSLTVDLKPGKYVLICNIPGHAQAGMVAAFTVS